MAVFRIEKTRDFTVMSNHHLKNTSLSLKAKGLQSLMLSLPEMWDYSLKGLAKICKDGVDSIAATLNELERHGYLTRRRLRDTNGRLGDTEYTIHEQPVVSVESTEIENPEKPANPTLSPKRGKPVQVNPVLEKPVQALPILEKPKQEKPAQSITNQSSISRNINTHGFNIQSINLDAGAQAQATALKQAPTTNPTPIDRIDGMPTAYRELILDNVEYDNMVERFGEERMDEVVELMLETVLSQRKYIRIAGDEYPFEVVKSRLLKITADHLEYVFHCIDKNTTKIRNIKAYLLTALYNATVTMDTYYRAEVNHDFANGNLRKGVKANANEP